MSESFGAFCVTSDAGTRLCAEVSAALGSGQAVCLDFSNVKMLTSSFLNPALGCLYGQFSPEFLDLHLTFEGLDDVDRDYIRGIRDNAIRYYSASPEDRARLVEAEERRLLDTT